MAFPWNRNDESNQEAVVTGRQRGRARRARQEETRSQNLRNEDERRKQRLAITLGAMLILIIFSIVGIGWYQEFYSPPRELAGEINNVRFEMGDLVDRIRVLQGYTRYNQGGFVDLSIVPFEYLQDMLNSEILRQQAPLIGIAVTDEDIDGALRRKFYPTPPEGQEVEEAQLDREYQNSYTTFLTATNLTDDQYRVILEERLLEFQLLLLLGQGIPDSMDQVEVEWIRLEPEGPLPPREVRERLDNEEFAAVAAEVSSSKVFSNRQGYVGWVPQEAFPRLDTLLFGDPEEEIAALAEGEISDPVFTQDGIYIIHKLADPDDQPLSDLMRFKLNRERVDQWQQDQLTRGSAEGWLKINFDSNRYAWVADQIRLTAPRVPQQPRRPQGPLGPGGF
jgi:parvulin-like peptidyl-prolyl isomerase